jgi:hypothetical protein
MKSMYYLNIQYNMKNGNKKPTAGIQYWQIRIQSLTNFMAKVFRFCLILLHCNIILLLRKFTTQTKENP